ncbi:hypothetical protein [Draconibacterium mangrovi]|uniref:hypothetical protein n=1 Tax=Draconibacterium mangrovi TaxID=2697469 RepID=UPI0013D133D9|nr:hypothetical protein [Draconibacterium mangrovi]
MVTKKTLSEAEALEQYRVSLTNVEIQPELATSMAEFGYDTTVIAEGKTLLAETRQIFDLNKTEDDETSEAYAAFQTLKEQLDATYRMHRKKAKVIFRNDPQILEELALTGSLSNAYIKWLETVRRFYNVAGSRDAQIQPKLLRLKITAEDITNAMGLIADLEAARGEYLREKGESQEATRAKDAAFERMDDWMSEFYAVAKIAMEDKPQLLEALGKLVRS